MKTNKKIERFILSDQMWNQISPYFPSEKGRNARPSKSNRLIFEGMLYKLRVGCPWRDLPFEVFGPWQTVSTRFYRWVESGVFLLVFSLIKDELSSEYLALDSSTVRAHQHAHGAAKKKAISA